MKTFSATEDQLDNIASFIVSEAKAKPIVLLKGNLGAGKTTLTKAIIRAFGILDSVTSPTFNIVSTYTSPTNITVNHFDLYRIKSIEELYEIGFDEYLESGNYCIIEWPEIAESFFGDNVLTVSIEPQLNGRIYTIV